MNSLEGIAKNDRHDSTQHTPKLYEQETEAAVQLLTRLIQAQSKLRSDPTCALLEHAVQAGSGFLSARLDEQRYLSQYVEAKTKAQEKLGELDGLLGLIHTYVNGPKIENQTHSIEGDDQQILADSEELLTQWLSDLRHLQPQLPAFNTERAKAGRQSDVSHTALDAEKIPPLNLDVLPESEDSPARSAGVDAKPDPSPNGMRLEVRLFGNFTASLNGVQINDWPKGKAKQLFKFLAYRAQPIPKEVLMELFWPNYSTDSARNNLNVTIYSLRQTLKKAGAVTPCVVFDDGAYRFGEEVTLWVDTSEFEQRYLDAKKALHQQDKARALELLSEAASLYRGMFLEDAQYLDWTNDIRENLRDKYIFVLEKLAENYLSLKAYDDCIHINRKLLELDNCNERAHQHLMTCYYESGQRHLALRQYEICRTNLAEELNIRPNRETESLYQFYKQGGLESSQSA